MMELWRVDQWLYGLLSGDATLSGLVGTRIYADVAPQGATRPNVVFVYLGGHDVRGVGPARIMADAVYLVKAVGDADATDYGALAPIVDRVDALLQGASGSAGGGQVLACVREQAIRYTEVASGQRYRHLGGQYRIWAQ